jgi:hypothetical protein
MHADDANNLLGPPGGLQLNLHLRSVVICDVMSVPSTHIIVKGCRVTLESMVDSGQNNLLADLRANQQKQGAALR